MMLAFGSEQLVDIPLELHVYITEKIWILIYIHDLDVIIGCKPVSFSICCL